MQFRIVGEEMGKGFATLLFFLASLGCQTVGKGKVAISAKTAALVTKDVGQSVKWRWSWNGKTASLNEPFLFHIMYSNAAYLGLRADSPISAATGCVAGTDCSSECSFEVFRPTALEGDVLTDRVLVSCMLTNPRAPKGMNQIYLAGFVDGLAISYRPKSDGERSVTIKGNFATEMYYSFRNALQNSRYTAKAGVSTPQNRKPIYQYLVPKADWYFLFRLDNQSSTPGESNLSVFCSTPSSKNEESTCVFRL